MDDYDGHVIISMFNHILFPSNVLFYAMGVLASGNIWFLV